MTVHSGNILLENEKKKSYPWSLALDDPRWFETAMDNFPLEMKKVFLHQVICANLRRS